jgi:hypothetical protein
MRDNAYTEPPAAAVTSKQNVAITDAAPMIESTKNNELSYCTTETTGQSADGCGSRQIKVVSNLSTYYRSILLIVVMYYR